MSRKESDICCMQNNGVKKQRICHFIANLCFYNKKHHKVLPCDVLRWGKHAFYFAPSCTRLNATTLRLGSNSLRYLATVLPLSRTKS